MTAMPGTHQWYDGTPASVGVQAGLAPGAFARPTRTPSTPVRRTRRSSARTMADRRWQELPALRGGQGASLAARRWRHVPAHDPARSQRPGAHLRRHLGRRSLPHRRRRRDLAADQPRPEYRDTSSPTRTPTSATASTASRCIRRGPTRSSCRSTGTSCAATTPVISGTRSAATCPATSVSRSSVHAHEPETIYVVPIKSDSEHFPPEGKLRVYRSRTGGNEWEALTNGLPQEQLLRQRAARRDVR